MNANKQPLESFPWHVWEQHNGNQRFNAAVGQPGRIISGRLLPGCDMLLGIIELAKSNGVKSAWVNAFGSLAETNFSPGLRFAASDPDRVERLPNVNLAGPIEVWSGMGRLSIPDEGEPVIHFHGVVVSLEGQLYGGHFFPGGNPVYATFEVHIQELLDIEFKVEMDPVVELPMIEPIQKA